MQYEVSDAPWFLELWTYVEDEKLKFGKAMSVDDVRDITYGKPTAECPEGCYFGFCRGSKDLWAAVVVQPTSEGRGRKAFATDRYYFSRLALIAAVTGKREDMFAEIKELYDLSTDMVDASIVSKIDDMSKRYGPFENILYNMMLHIYYGWIAEEHYQRRWSTSPDRSQKTRVGKLMKMVGVYSLLMDKMDVGYVCDRHKGKSVDTVMADASACGIERNVTWEPYSTEYDKLEYLPVVNRW